MADDTTTTEADTATETKSTEQESFSADEVKSLRDRAKAAEKAAKDHQRQLQELSKKFEGIDLDDLRSKAAKVEEAERKAAERDPAKMEELFERKRQRLAEEYETKLKTATEEAEKLRKVNKTLAVTDRVMTEIGSLFNTDAAKFIKREVEERCDLDDDGTIIVRGDDGEVMYRGARPLSIKEFGEQLREQYPSLAKAAGTGGGKDATPGEKKPGRFRVPQTMDELNSLPNSKEVWESLSYDDKKRLGKTMKFSA